MPQCVKVEVQTEPILLKEKWTQKPPRAAETEDPTSVRQNLLGVGGGEDDVTGVRHPSGFLLADFSPLNIYLLNWWIGLQSSFFVYK